MKRFLLLAGASLVLAQDLQLDLNGYRSLAAAARRLREKTGWLLCVEEPQHPARASATGVGRDPHGAEPPPPDRLRVSIASLRRPGDRDRAVRTLVNSYNAQNPGSAIRASSAGPYHLLIPAAGSVLDRRITVPLAVRSPQGHLEAIAAAVSQTSSIAVRADTGAFGFDFNTPYWGNFPGVEVPFAWAATREPGRDALIRLLSRSLTSTVWQVDCQAGIQPAKGHCILSLMPLTVEIAGTTTKRPLLHDRAAGTRGRVLPPPPLPPQP